MVTVSQVPTLNGLVKKATPAIRGQRPARPQMPLVRGCLLLKPLGVSALDTHGNPSVALHIRPGREPSLKFSLTFTTQFQTSTQIK